MPPPGGGSPPVTPFSSHSPPFSPFQPPHRSRRHPGLESIPEERIPVFVLHVHTAESTSPNSSAVPQPRFASRSVELGQKMTEGEEKGGLFGGKVDCVSSSKELLTYKRRKRPRAGLWSDGEPTVSPEEQILERPHHIHLCNANSELSTKAGIPSHCWRNLLEQLAHSSVLEDGCLLKSCIGKVKPLSCEPPLEPFKGSNVKAVNKKKHQKKEHYQFPSHSGTSNGVLLHNQVNSNEPEAPVNGPADNKIKNSKYWNIFFDLLVSQKPDLLCSLLNENFQGCKIGNTSDFSTIISKMNGAHRESTEHGFQHIQRTGEEMMLLASGLSDISQDSCRKQERQFSSEASGERDFECAHAAVDKENVSVNSFKILHLEANNLDSSPEPNHRGAHHFHDVSTSKRCDSNAHEIDHFVSDGHEPLAPNLGCKESAEILNPATIMPLCKHCGSCEEDDKLFLVCSHIHCLYKYYHIRCLKSTQVASQHQHPNNWYCPSCLCRGCLIDRDDELICICDACDEAYHIYCMKPPRNNIPDGTWYCYHCEKSGKGTNETQLSLQ